MKRYSRDESSIVADFGVLCAERSGRVVRICDSLCVINGLRLEMARRRIGQEAMDFGSANACRHSNLDDLLGLIG